MKPFEDCLSFIEDYLGIQLFSYQKEVLKMVYDNKPYYYLPARGSGLTTFRKAMMLLEELKKGAKSK